MAKSTTKKRKTVSVKTINVNLVTALVKKTTKVKVKNKSNKVVVKAKINKRVKVNNQVKVRVKVSKKVTVKVVVKVKNHVQIVVAMVTKMVKTVKVNHLMDLTVRTLVKMATLSILGRKNKSSTIWKTTMANT